MTRKSYIFSLATTASPPLFDNIHLRIPQKMVSPTVSPTLLYTMELALSPPLRVLLPLFEEDEADELFLAPPLLLLFRLSDPPSAWLLDRGRELKRSTYNTR